MRKTGRRFTLMELLVVTGIVIILLSLSVPSITKFMQGQSLQQSGRIVQSAFNEARRAAITQQNDNYIIIFRTPDTNRPGEQRWGMRRYREGIGYEGEAHLLLPGVRFDTDAGGALVGTLNYDVFDGLPKADTAPFNGSFQANTGIGKWFRFRPDGRIELMGGMSSGSPPTHAGKSIFDETNTDVDNVKWAVMDGWKTACDFSLVESGNDEKRCFLDLNPNTGMIRVRVVKDNGEA